MLIRIEENRVEKLQPRKFDDNNEINSISNFCINNNNNNNNNNNSSSRSSRSQTNNNKHLTETTSSSTSSILTFSTFNNNYRKQSFHQKPPSNAIKVKNRQTININNNINQENQTIIKENNNNKKNQIDNNNNSSLKGNRFGILSFSGLGFRSDKPTNKITFNNSDNQKELLLLKDNSNTKENSIINSLSIKKRKSSYVVEEQELSSEIVAHKIVESTVEFERGGGGGGGGGLPNAKKFKENHTMNEYMHSSTIDSSLRSSGALGSYILSKSDLNNIDDNTIMHTDKHYQQHNHINSSNSHHNQHHNNNNHNHHHHNHHNNNNSHNHHQSTNVLSSNASSNHQHQQYLNGISNSMATLSNIGNTCYLNSVIYTLRFAPFFLHNLHHLVDDLSQINKKIIQRQQTKVSSLGRNIGGLHGTNARSWSSKDLVSLGINSSYSTSMSSGIITSGTSTIGSKYQSSSSTSTSNSSSAVTTSNITTVLPANVTGGGGGGTSAIEIDKTNRQIATEKLHELYRNLHLAEQTATNIEPFHADTFLSSIQAVSSIFEGNQQQDAHEFLMCLLDSIRETCQSVIKVICDCPDIIMNGYVNLPEQNNYEIMKPPKCIPAPKKNSFFSRKPKRKDTIVNKLSTGNNSAGVVVAQTQTQTQTTTTTSITNTNTAAILVAGGQIKETESALNSPLKSIQLNDSKSCKTTVDSVDGKLQNGNHRGGGGGGDRQLTTNEQQNSGDCGIISNANININNNIINNGNHNVENNSTKEKLNENIRKLGLDFFTEDFEGITVSTTKCLSCETITEQKETMIDLSIPITGFENMETNDKSHLFIQNLCITKEQFRGDNKYRCEQCLDYTEAIRTISYPILPRLLIIQLKRFSGGMEKINSYIPTQFLLQCFCSKCYALPEHQKLHIYKLYSVITHVGATLSVGHYIAYTCALNLSATNDTINNSNNNINNNNNNNNNNSNSNNCNNINSEYLNCPKEKQQCIQGKLKILSMSSSSGGMGMGSNNNHNNNHSISTAINGGQSDIFDSKNINNINQKNGTVNNPLNSISSSSTSTTTSSNNNNNSKYSGFVKKLIFGRNKASSSGDITKSVKNLNGDSGFNGNNNNNNGNNNNNNSSNSNSNSINDCIDNQLNIPCKSLHCCGIHMKVNQHSNGNQTGIIRNNDLITPITNHNHNHQHQHHHHNNNNNHHQHQHYNNNTDHHSSSSSSTTSSTTSATLNANLSMSSVSHHYQKNPDAIWYMCDDDKIKAMSQIEFEDLLLPNKKNTITPYLLFYARIDLQSVVVNDQQQSHPQEHQQSQSPQKYHQEDSTVLQMYDFVTKL